LNLTNGAIVTIIGCVIASVGFVLEVYTESVFTFSLLRETYVTVFLVVALVGAGTGAFGEYLRRYERKQVIT